MVFSNVNLIASSSGYDFINVNGCRANAYNPDGYHDQEQDILLRFIYMDL